jgi:hypothetical protein
MGIRNRASETWMFAVLCFLAVGCSRPRRIEPPRHPVTGTVTLDGDPLSAGKMRFMTPSEGIIDVVPIRDGVFSGHAVAGNRRIEFSVVKDVPYKGPAMPGVQTPATALAETLPRAFNSDSTFTASVTAEGPNAFVFELKSPR